MKHITSITQIHQEMGLGKPLHPLVSVLFFNEIDLKNVHTAATDKYSMDLYNISMKDGVNGSIGYGRNSYDFHEGTMVFTKPGQVLYFGEKEYEEDPQGWSILFHPDLIRKSPLGQHIAQYSFFSYEVNEALHLSDREKMTLTNLAHIIQQELSQNIDQHTQKLIVSNIELVLDYCTRYFDRQFYTRTNLNKDIVSRFEQLLKDYYDTEKMLELGIPSVKYCGKELGMSPNYLSDLLRKETGKNAQENIQYFLMDRAKTKLLSSNESVGQIAYGLGFEYPQHFSKLFKNKTGMSPSEYRKTT